GRCRAEWPRRGPRRRDAAAQRDRRDGNWPRCDPEDRSVRAIRQDRSGKRMLLVHAHPDDETINNGATMSRYVAEGAQVTLLTCTLGEEGEILVPELAQLAADQADQLGGYRIWGLGSAMADPG